MSNLNIFKVNFVGAISTMISVALLSLSLFELLSSPWV